jgi:glycine cleavage system aminomethyltransferase T
VLEGYERPPASIAIRVAGARLIDARVVPPCFYDPDNARQRMGVPS